MERGTVESIVASTGTLQATETVEVGTQVSGQIAHLYVDFNDRVKEGDLLARIDPTLLQQEVASAQANVQRNRAEQSQALRTLERNRLLHAEKVMTDSELEQAEYAHEVAQATLTAAEVALERARRNLSYSEIRAPSDGVIVDRSVDVGQTVAASLQAPTLFVLARDLSEMEILAAVDESDIGRIHQGQEVRFTVQAHGNQAFTGEVEQVRLQSKTQENVVSYSVVVRVNNADGRLLPGMTATAEFLIARATDVLKVPNAALRFQPNAAVRALADVERTGAAGGAQALLWSLDADGIPRAVLVSTGLTDGQYTEVSGPELQEGMQVIAAAITSGAAQPAAANPFQGQRTMAPGGPPRGF
jgi:HlyD family secretion protein